MENRSLHIAESFIEASNTLINGAVLKAGFDKTIKANIKQLLDKPTGKYKVKYQDSQFQAFATSADIHYEEGQEVSVLIPGNDWDRDKTIVGSRPGSAMIYKQMPITDQQYNAVGPNGISIRVGEDSSTQQTELYRTGVIGIRSGLNESFSIKDFINISDIKSYIIKGNCIALNMIVRTDFGASQVGGNYGLRFALKFKDPIATTDPENPVYTIKSFTVSDADLFGNPYQVNVPTSVSTLITNVDTENFESIQDIYVYTEGFPQFQGEEFQNCPVDIFISGIGINGGISLTEEELEGYIVHINDPDGGVLKSEEEENPAIDVIKLIGELKVHGQLITQNVDYYWFIQNGTVFQGMDQYSGHAGEGWQCLNPKVGTTFSPFKVPYFYFMASEGGSTPQQISEISNYEQYLKAYKDLLNKLSKAETEEDISKIKKQIEDLQNTYSNYAKEIEKNNYFIDPYRKIKVCCVAFYQGKNIKGQYTVLNEYIIDDITIDSSQKKEGQNKTQYYLGNGRPTLTCIVNPYTKQLNELMEGIDELKEKIKKVSKEEKLDIQNEIAALYEDITNLEKNHRYEYQWTIKPANGQLQKVEQDNIVIEDGETKIFEGLYSEALELYQEYKENLSNSDGSKYAAEAITSPFLNQEGIDLWQSIKDKPYVQKNKYINFPINSITNSVKVTCAVYQVKEQTPEGEEEPIKKRYYIGSASITLYNKMQLQGMYTLVINNGTQIFQYDEKGNSPFVEQADRKPMEQPKPLTFTLLDNTGTQIAYNQIIDPNYGSVRWLFPKNQTLLTTTQKDFINNNVDIVMNSTDSALAADFYILKNKPSFTYSIEDRYSLSKTNNNIGLLVNYKENSMQAWTDFTFPKNGDPGTNGTQLIAKIIPQDSNSVPFTTDRLYAVNNGKGLLFTDSGNKVEKLGFAVYNNNNVIFDDASKMLWSCPPKAIYETESTSEPQNTFLKYRKDGNPKFQLVNLSYRKDKHPGSDREDLEEYKPINIIRCQYGLGKNDETKYYAEYPICYQYIKDDVNQTNYRIKVKPKTGFKYVTYASDGTRPDYDNSKPFEIIVEKHVQDKNYYTKSDISDIKCKWYFIGNLQFDSNKNKQEFTEQGAIDKNTGPTGNKCYVKPKEEFDGLVLNSAIVVEVSATDGSDDIDIGFIHIPIYMNLNRYGNNAINGWDGNSIELKEGSGTILAPQVGAGRKETESNTFTGVLMGVQDNGSKGQQVGLFGYNKGERSIFLDAESGKAEFGKQGAGKIIFNPNQKINNQDSALIYSGNYPIEVFKNKEEGKYNVKTTAEVKNRSGKGMIIDLSTPQIGFGSGNFTVDENGNITARGDGEIAGWRINDDAIYKHDGINKTGMKSNGDPAFYAGTNAQNSNAPTSSKAYNFFVNHDGYLYSKSGKIGGWNISSTNLMIGENDSNSIGMGTNRGINTVFSYRGTSTTIPSTAARFWAGSNFIVDNTGKLYSNSAIIGPWGVSSTAMTNGNTGMGQKTFNNTTGGTNGFNTFINARFWSGTNGGNSGLNFAVDNNGYLYSKAGYIAGWKIGENQLTGGNTKINKEGSLSGPGWQIKANGDAKFNHLHGIIAPVSDGDSDVSLTAGEGFYVDSSGYFRAGSGDSALTYSPSSGSGSSATQASLKMGAWTIEGKLIYYKNLDGTKIAPEGITVSSSASGSNILNGKIQTGVYQAKDGNVYKSGQTGIATFSDDSKMHFVGGILVKVEKGSQLKWS